MKAIQARVTGQVQGVAFRWHAQERAQQLGVVGWVRIQARGGRRSSAGLAGSRPSITRKR